MSLFQFGEKVDGYDVAVLNEREIRAAAGLLFVMMFVAVVLVIFKWEFSVLKYASSIFLADILIRVLVNPKYAPTLIIGRLIVRNQNPEYVGAPQKKFAWIIGIVLAATMFITLVVLNMHSPINGLICMVCLLFLFCESAFGICIGCKVYSLVYGKKAQYCPGEVCEVKDRKEIQRTSGIQLSVLLVIAGLLYGVGYNFKDHFAQQPLLVMGMQKPPHLK